MKPFPAPPVGRMPALPIRAAHFMQLAVLTDTLNHIHIACPEWYGKEPHICITFDRVEDRRFFMDGDTMVTAVTIPGSFTLRGEIVPIDDGVKLRLSVTNLSETILPESPAVVCVQCAAAPSFADPLLETVLHDQAAGGAVKVVVFPFFIGSGSHILEDIPNLVKKAGQDHPAVEFVLTRHLGKIESVDQIIINEVAGG